MQVTQTLVQGLKQEFSVVLPAGDLSAKLETQLVEMKAKAHLKGFRPGKAPLAHLRKLYGKSVMGEVLQEAVNEANQKIIEEHKLRIAADPKLDFPHGQEGVEKALEAQGDFAYTVTFETLPAIELTGFDDISVDRPVAPISEADVDSAIADLARRFQEYEPRSEDGARAEKSDKLTIDFIGRVDGEPFEGGTGADVELVLGSSTFIPGFEDQLEGASAGEQKLVKVRFPDNYSAAALAGKDAEFDVTVKTLARPKPQEVDEEFAKKWGFDTTDALRVAVRGNLEADFDKASREKLKRALLDALDARYKFDVPESLLEQEFQTIWRDYESEKQRGGLPPADAAKSEDDARAEYRGIAGRRVRLGLLLAEIGRDAGVKVEEQDLTNAVIERARQFPGREKQVWDFYRNNEQALAQLRAPIYEERVIDHLSRLVKIAEKTVTREQLFADDEDDRPAVG